MEEIFTSSLMQSYVFSPLMGVIFGALFAGLSAKPSASAPVTVIETRRIYVHRVKASARSRQGDGGEIFGLAILLIFVVWKYLQIAPEVLNYIRTILMTMIAFGVTCFIVSAVKGHFLSSDWSIRVVTPTGVLLSCLALLAVAENQINDELVDMANRLNMIQFFTDLPDFWRYSVVFHLIGICLLLFVAIINTLNLLHYLALMNQRDDNVLHGLWSFITSTTDRFSGKRAYIVSALLLTLCFFLFNDQITLWVMPSSS